MAADLEIGRILKPHGLTGEAVVELSTNVPGRLAPGASFVTDVRPLVVQSVRPHQGRHLVRFEGVRDRAGAESLRGLVLRAKPVAIEGALWVHELVGARALDVGGRALGRVVAVEPNPASDLLVLDTGALVPLRFVTGLDPGREVIVDAPEGLVE